MLDELKKELQITYEDPDVDQRLQRYLREGQAYLKGKVGLDIDCTTDENKPLLFAYCRYAFYHALEHFQKNYHHDIVSLRKREAIKHYASKSRESHL